jgi:hypothetical protein
MRAIRNSVEDLLSEGLAWAVIVTSPYSINSFRLGSRMATQSFQQSLQVCNIFFKLQPRSRVIDCNLRGATPSVARSAHVHYRVRVLHVEMIS